jgi:hypothetical protein
MEKSSIESLRTKPYSGTMIRLPQFNPTVVVIDTTNPVSSATVMLDVPWSSLISTLVESISCLSLSLSLASSGI